MPYFTHGLMLQHFDGVTVTDFKGSASPVNKNAYRIYAEDGIHLSIDDAKNVVLRNVK